MNIHETNKPELLPAAVNQFLVEPMKTSALGFNLLKVLFHLLSPFSLMRAHFCSPILHSSHCLSCVAFHLTDYFVSLCVCVCLLVYINIQWYVQIIEYLQSTKTINCSIETLKAQN